MLEKLEAFENRYRELNELLSQSNILADRKRYLELTKEHSELAPIVKCFEQWKELNTQIEESQQIVRETEDLELRQLAQEEVATLREQVERLHSELLELMMPKDPNDDKNVILEIRAGTGGDEAALFAGDLFSAYARYAEKRRWKVEILSSSESSVGGFKEVIASIAGNGAYSRFKYERGVHRVQRVPRTETQGRIHTSTVTVAVLPEAEEVEIEIKDADLRIDVFRSSGPGGQSVNTTDSAVRVTHIPSGLVVVCQDEKSQLKNKSKALTVLRSRLLDMKQAEQDEQRRDDRRSQIGTGERSERIRTYNFPQGRVSDHRINLTLYQIDSIMAGELDMLIDPLVTHFRSLALKGDAKA